MEEPQLQYENSLLFGGTETDMIVNDSESLTSNFESKSPKSSALHQETENSTHRASTESTMDFMSSVLFQPQEPVHKQVKLSDGNTVEIKLRVQKLALQDVSETDEISLMDINQMKERVKLRQTFKQHRETPEISHKIQDDVSLVWAEKYRPMRFVQLCSAGNDRSYRTISHWLRKWSSVVYNEEYDDEDETVDALGRPLRKFLLITGPPGIGKTSAAHIIAKQLGYQVEELNAANSMNVVADSGNSSNKVLSSLRLKIQNALTSNVIQKDGNKLVSNGKPTCLIIDEIDTAGNSSDIIRVLNEINQSDMKAMNKTVTRSTFDDDKKKLKDHLLNRPIICIANDAYSTSSRTYGPFTMDKLRNMSELVTFKKPAFHKTTAGVQTGGKALQSVKEYIKHISDRENLKLDYREIGEIVEVCEGDIRACINHLQFNGRKLTNPMLENKGVKMNKDAQLSWFRLSDMLFKRNPQLNKEDDFNELMEIVLNGSGKSTSSSNSTLDKVIKASFNRYLDSVYYQDDSLSRPCEISEWLDFYDRIGGNDSLDYASLVPMKFWSLFSDIKLNKSNKSLLPDIKSIEFESFEANKANKAVAKKLLSNLPTSLGLSLGGGFENNESFSSFCLPFIHRIISPEMTSSGSSSSLGMKLKLSLSEFDKRSLEKSASLTKDLGIKLESLRDTISNQITLEFFPNIDSLVYYNTEFLPIPYETNVKQIQLKRKWLFPLLQTELDRTGLIKNIEKRKLPPTDKDKKRQKIASSLEFFKGQYDGMSTQIQQAKDKVDNDATRIWVKYNEGFSNAVRKTIGWNDLWSR